MGKIIAAGHVCLDITPVFPAQERQSAISEILTPGKLIHMEPAEIHIGGSVANTGLALKMLGCDVTLMGKIGTDAFGSIIQESFAAYGAGGLITDEKSATSYTVVLVMPGSDRIFLHCPGANDTFVSADVSDAALQDAELFHFGYPPLMKTMYENDGAELVKLFRRVGEKGIVTSLDLAAVDPNSEAGKADWEKILSAVGPYVDLFEPSFEEVCWMLDRERYARLAAKGGDMTEHLNVRREAAPLAERLIAVGFRVVLIKCGASGMFYRTADRAALARYGSQKLLEPEIWGNKCGFQPCFRPEMIRSATGAGDASIAAFLAAIMKRKDPEECVALAAAEGACSVTAYDALSGLRSLPELEARIRSGWETD